MVFETTVTDIAKILSDTTRVKILQTLMDHGGMCVYEIAEVVGASQSATSHQLSKMEDKGLVECFREGQKMCYELTKSSLAKRIIETLVLLRKYE